MQIPVNKNLDDYKDDVFKGLTLRQAAMAALTVASGILGFAIGHFLLGLPQEASLYCAFPLAFPVAAAGFGRIRGLSIPEYIKRKQAIRRAPVYTYRPAMLEEGKEEKP